MLAIDQVLISDDVIEKKFVCDLSRCHGGCCVDGDTGAPLTEEETSVLDEIAEKVKPYLSDASVRELEKQGNYVHDPEAGFVTPAIEGKMCAYGIVEHGVVKCGIEKAFNDGAVAFKKPLSCHLYPIRVEQHDGYEAMNYEPRDILCRPACELGGKLQVAVFRFLKEAIIRGYGAPFYEAMEAFACRQSE